MIFMARLIALLLVICAALTVAVPWIPDDPLYVSAMGFDLRGYAVAVAGMLWPLVALGMPAALLLLARALAGED